MDKPTTATILRDPKVYLVGRQTVDDAAVAEFLADHEVSHWSTDTDEAGEMLVEIAGRLCYLSFAKPRPGGNKAYIGHILEVGHGSVLEHAVFNFIITGVSRSFTHELVRHRAGWAYSQLESAFRRRVRRLLRRARRDRRRPGIAPDLARFDRAEPRRLSEARRRPGCPVRRDRGPDPPPQEGARGGALRAAQRDGDEDLRHGQRSGAARHFIEMRGDAAADAEIRKVGAGDPQDPPGG